MKSLQHIALPFIMAVLVFCSAASVADAQSLWIYSTNGRVELRSRSSVWKAVNGICGISPSDSLRMSPNSSVTILDHDSERLVAVQKVGTFEVRKLLEGSRKNNDGALKKLVSFLWNSLRGEVNADGFRTSAGVVYRDNDVNSAVADAVRKGRGSLNVDFELLDENGRAIAERSVRIGEQAFVRVHNNTGCSLFVNLIDKDSQGNCSACMPVNSYTQLTQLLIPPYSDVLLDSFPIVFGEPKGKDKLILVASPTIFDIEQVVYCLENNQYTSSTKVETGIQVREYITR